MPPIKQRLAALKKALGVAGARDAQVTPFPALPEKAIAALERKHGVRLPDALREHRARLNWQQRHKTANADPDLLASLERDTPPESAHRARLDDLVKRIKANKRLELVRLDRYPLPPPNAFKKIAATFRSE